MCNDMAQYSVLQERGEMGRTHWGHKLLLVMEQHDTSGSSIGGMSVRSFVFSSLSDLHFVPVRPITYPYEPKFTPNTPSDTPPCIADTLLLHT